MSSVKYDKGSEWRKWDLHFHTPSSFDYRNDGVTNQEIIDVLVAKGISVVAITDHHYIDVQRIKDLQKLGEGKVTVLPGIELRSELGGSESVHFIGIFSQDAPADDIWTDIQSRCNIKPSQVKEVGDDKVYCDFEDTCSLIHELGGIVSIHAGGKSNSIESIKNNHTFKQKLKKDLVSNCIDIFELGAVDDQEIYNSLVFPAIGMRRAMIICSDNHDVKNYNLKENLWIKADPNFEGLKQIIHEPEDRVKIQPTLPEDKAGYLVIDRIEITSSYIYNTTLQINPNLNSVIGGRSAGKSILLAAIAKKLKTDKPIKFEHNLEYGEFVGDVSQGIQIIWKDQEENNEREIEYFEQGYMYELARKEAKLSMLIQTILKQKGKEAVLNNYEREIINNKKLISDQISDLYRNLKETSDKEKKVSDKGDKKGIEDEIIKLISELEKLNVVAITDEEKATYQQIKESIEIVNQNKTIILNDIVHMTMIKNNNFLKEDISYELTPLSDLRKKTIQDAFNVLKSQFKLGWSNEVDRIISEAYATEVAYNNELEILLSNPIYQKVLNAFKDSSQLSEYEEKIQIQKHKLFEITSLLSEIDELKIQTALIKENIINAHKSFHEKTLEILPKLSEATDGLEIKAKAKFDSNRYKEILVSSLNQQGYLNQNLSNFEHKANTDYEVQFTSIFNKLLKNELTLKGGYSNQSLLNTLMSECFYFLSYDIEFDGDDFAKMSDGKKAFVVLKLLLDFSNKDCPILIDQPEDDLDNRAIYQDLVQYLKKKKKVRQIILATHNPNIVVGADSELIIAANQHGLKNFNREMKKFQYVSGSLENTCEKDSAIIEILECQGIREHICELLEGGNRAFKLRERKYSLPKSMDQIA